jgi:hypothetical protein
MTNKKAVQPNASAWHPSLKKTFKGCQRWMDYEAGAQRLEKYLSEIQEDLSKMSALERIIYLPMRHAGHALGVRASCLSGHDDWATLPEPLTRAVRFHALGFRCEVFHCLLPSSVFIPSKFSTSMQVAGSAMLSHWRDAEIGARLLIDVAHKDQAVKPEKWRKDGWGKGTHDAFLIALFSQVFNIPTHYRPARPLIAEYQTLLEVWRTTEESIYVQAMQAAAEFHISRSKDATERNDYEFDDYFHRVYPAELLAVQALRRREGLPEFTTGHLLIDTPWPIIRDLPDVAPDPLLVEVEARMKRDYPDFR